MSSLPLWTRAELCQATGGALKQDVNVENICIDTRQLKPHDLFIALKGHNSDGHRFLKQALEKGAACVVAHDQETIQNLGLTDDPRLLIVHDTMHALETLGRFARQRFKGKAIAITGSVGKTTTKNMLQQALTPYGKVHASVASFNNHWGVPLTLARLPRDADFCLSEIGMNHPGEITPLAQQVRPDIALITSVGSAHLGYMGSLEAIAAEKASLFAALTSPHGRALIPDNVPHLNLIIQSLPPECSLWQVGEATSSTIRIMSPHYQAEGSQCVLHTPSGEFSLHLNAPGAHLLANASLVMGVICSLGLEPYPATQALAHFSPEAGRGEHRSLPGDVTLIDESYNASGPSMRAALATLALIPASRRIAVLGDMRELGEFADEEHRTLRDPIVACNALTFCCGTHMKILFEALPTNLQGGYAPDSRHLASLLRNALRPGDLLLVKGSLGSRMRDLIDALNQPSSNQEDSLAVSF
ncbi:UDP-N-acetylmuramoyl-tripeptide--D-alanyl-D-alanine ligase [Saccharibacter sp. 17.LH.SD]|uniref:UDP-N-acetylmuramoyl-tripeptide--D-alanyl-D- alanine ligase n=1 Tax=Saccharibacter sp. 17.LH.SD TaxID=2689393 RepID=UPI0013720CD2|nr:UDP-N-acetylmuramoyl-tripeptide--D-alanyl-D-alanine ligase [Saccharibacter sp. 17.LH.SD]MXV44667.1 UDP-N-acetylmuramoyl-tripeptide--D-alanyl-D-alanine ligase [Saccharibacter sp. 17.LH.SD]